MADLEGLLQNNLKICSFIDPPNRDLKPKDMFSAAVELEYDVFSSNKVIVMYRNSMAKLVSIVSWHYLVTL